MKCRCQRQNRIIIITTMASLYVCVLLDYRLVSQRHLQQNLMKYYCANSIYGYHLWFLISKPVHELFEWEK